MIAPTPMIRGGAPCCAPAHPRRRGAFAPPQLEMLAVIDEAIRDPRGCCVAAMLCGHVHVDRLNGRGPVPSLLVNSASYHWDGEMVPYRDPLYAFITLTTDGWCRIEGRPGDWATPRRAAQIDPDRLGVRPAITSRSVRTSAMG